jgi:hypothetical protein
MLNTPRIGQPVQLCPAQGSTPTAAVIVKINDSSPTGSVCLTLFPAPGSIHYNCEKLAAVPHLNANGPKPTYPCWREI